MWAALLLLVAAWPLAAGAVDFNEPDEPPTPTETTTECAEGTVWDAEARACVTIKDARVDQDRLYDMVRELAWAGRVEDARLLLVRLEDADRRLTYLGFLDRTSGDWPSAEAHYQQAIARNPDNLLARSYYGQGLAARGEIDAARAQLTETRQRGGRQSWPEVALRLSIAGGSTGY